jgi:hypothetical protein
VKVGDLVMSRKGNPCVILNMEHKYKLGVYLDVLFIRTGHIRTGYHSNKIKEVLSESR